MELQLQVAIGCILGDGRLDAIGPGNSRLLVRHSIKQYEYLAFKHSMLKPYSLGIFCIEWVDRRTGKLYRAAGFNTVRHRVFTELYHAFYPKGRKVVPRNLSEIAGEVALAILIGDDGTYDQSSRTVKISVDAYDLESRKRIRDWLLDMGIESTIEKDRIYILRRSLPQLVRLTSRYLPPSMLYKLGIDSPPPGGTYRRETGRTLPTGGAGRLRGRRPQYERNGTSRPLVDRPFDRACRAATPWGVTAESI